jgi:hypothetical protein
VTDVPNGPWFTSLPPCEALVPCGQGRHAVRWEAGELRLPSHADLGAELVLAALGGEKARCVEIAEAWGRHVADLTVLGIGPRSPADEVAVSWEDVDAAGHATQGAPGRGPMRLASPPTAAMARAAIRRLQYQQEAGEAGQRRLDMLSLLALGTAFQVRLIGHVVAAHADRLDEPAEHGPHTGGHSIRPALTAALAGRLAPVAEQWLGIDPDQVEVSLLPSSGPGLGGYGGAGSPSQGGSGGMGPPGKGRRGIPRVVPPDQHSWGSVELTGRGEQRRLRVSLPVWWLARVWACGLALTGRHLVVAVERAGWPDARVLALRAPGAEPVSLSAHASDGPPGAPNAPHWEI